MSGEETAQPVSSAVPPEGGTRRTGREIEIRFLADHTVLKALPATRLLSDTSFGSARELVSVYFDTPTRDLARNGITLRVRRKGRSAPLLGVKWIEEDQGDLFARGEVEVRMPDGEPSVDLFEPELRDRLKDVLGKAALDPVFKTHVRRRTALVRHGASEIELALDNGFIIAGDERLTLSELELELKSGHAADLVAFARDLAAEGGLSLQFESKAARGHRLAVAAAEPPQKARPVLLPENSGFDDLVAAVLSGSLWHFTANWAALRQSDAPESIHQMRVALRRLRSALMMFRRRVAAPELENIRARARRIASGLGPARECDAFRQNALAGPFRDQPKRMGAAALLLEAVENRRVESYAAARRLIDGPEATLFVLDLQGLIARRAWRNAISASDLDLLAAPARDFATEVLDRLRRRALKRGKHLPDMSDEARHDLRIALKNLRYAVEFFGSLFDGDRRMRKTLRRVAGLQDDLGAHNDAVTAESFIASLGLPPDPEAHFAAGFLLGYGRHATIIANAHLAKRWKEFRRAPRFWR